MKRILFLITVVVLVVVAINIAISIVTLWSKKDLLLATQQKLMQEKKEREDLQQKLHNVSSQQFLEEEARNKLFLGKPGEVVVLFPTASPSGKVTINTINQPYWQQWLSLFVY